MGKIGCFSGQVFDSRDDAARIIEIPKCSAVPYDSYTLGNFPREMYERYEKAIMEYSQTTGDTSLSIRDIAYDIKGKVVDGYCSLVAYGDKNWHTFWNIYRDFESKGD